MKKPQEQHWSGMPKGFWSYEAPDPEPPPTHMTLKEWYSLSPGMRREIKRGLNKDRKEN